MVKKWGFRLNRSSLAVLARPSLEVAMKRSFKNASMKVAGSLARPDLGMPS